ncbi:MAG: 30S ribosomal protein S6, partial [Chloroflexi bacterium]|nr:30S ribosomal protein S6 [Chloroflexota bacterium]
WGTKRLAYPIQRFREGNYFLTQFQADPEVTEEIESALRVSEEVIRHLLVRVGK